VCLINIGGCYFDFGEKKDENPVVHELKISNSIFNCSNCEDSGGAIYVTGNGLVTIQSSRFTKCKAVNCGGALELFTTVTITDSLFSRCYAGS
jgi:predicted outer membrane repeat protein